ncbi:hypothetical protein D3C78_1461700 [compost metagenome]
MHVQAAVVGGVATVQHVLVEEGLALRLAGAGEEGFQQAVFGGGQAGAVAVQADVAAFGVETQAAGTVRKPLVAALQRHPAKDRIDAHAQLGEAERLGQVVVGALGEAGDAVLLGAQRGHEDHRHALLPA